MSAYFPVVSGAGANDRIVNQPFTMGVTAATPGDLSVSITSQTCRYDKVGDFVDVSIMLVFTPTYTTASGNLILTGLPFPADSDTSPNIIPMGQTSAFAWANNATFQYLSPQAGLSSAVVIGTKSAATSQALPVTAFTSGTSYTLRFRGRYRTTRV